MSGAPNIHIDVKGDPEKMAQAIAEALTQRKAKPAVNVEDAKKAAAVIVNVTGTILMCLAAWHFAGIWGLVAIWGLILGPFNRVSR
jgi:hypothetical protein